MSPLELLDFNYVCVACIGDDEAWTNEGCPECNCLKIFEQCGPEHLDRSEFWEDDKRG